MNRKIKKQYKKAVSDIFTLMYGTIMRKYLAEFYREYGSTFFKTFKGKNYKILVQIRHDAINPYYFLKSEKEWEKYDSWRDAVLADPIRWMQKYRKAEKRNHGYYMPSLDILNEMSYKFGGSY